MAKPIADKRDLALITRTSADMARAHDDDRGGLRGLGPYRHAEDRSSFKIACDRAPEAGVDLMSHPTLSRLENQPDAMALHAISRGFIDLFCTSHKTPPASIMLDVGDTDSMTHGQQGFALFNTHARRRAAIACSRC